MKRYFGGNTVKQGLYMNQRTLEFSQVNAENPRLPETDNEKFIRIPVPAALVLGPVFGLIFIMALPLIGIAGILFLVSYKAGLTQNNVARKLFQVFMASH